MSEAKAPVAGGHSGGLRVVLVALVGAQYAGVVPAPVAPPEDQWALPGLAHRGLVTEAF